MRKNLKVVFSISCQFDTIDAPDLACTNPTHCYFIGKNTVNWDSNDSDTFQEV